MINRTNTTSDQEPDADSYYDTFASEIDAVYRELGAIDDELYSTCNVDYTRWYRSRSKAGGEWDGTARGWALGREFQAIRNRLNPRIIHATTTYAPAEWFLDAWTRYRWPDDEEERDSRHWDADADAADDPKPLPNYADHGAYVPFVDIDIEDSEVKARRPDGEIPADVIADALAATVDQFAELADSRAAVFALDSVGGAYVLLSPTVTRPLCETFGPADRGVLIEDLTQRLNNQWLPEVERAVFDAVPEADGLLKFDKVNNKNRAYKAPLSIHKDHDGVVTPIDTEAVRYEYTPIAAVDDALIDETKEWAAQFTADHAAAIAPIVRALWPEYAADADGWRDALQARLADLTEQETTQQREADMRTPYPTRDGKPAGVELDDLDVTDDMDDVHTAIESIDMFELAEQLADEWETAGGRDQPRFAGPWYSSHNSGEACYVIDADRFYDTAAGAGGGPLQFVAAERGIITAPGEKITGDDFWRAVEALREEGYHIPRFRGKDGTHKDALKVYADTEEDDDLKAILRNLMADS